MRPSKTIGTSCLNILKAAPPRINVDEFLAPPGFREFEAQSYVLRVNEYRGLELYHAETEALIDTQPSDSTAFFELPLIRFSIQWPNLIPGSALYFRLDNHEETVQDLKERLAVDSPANTSLIRVAVRSSSPHMAQRTANFIGEKFRETRIEQKRETIRYSSDFVDNQLEEISANLKAADEALSDFRGENQLTDVDESTREALEFLSNMEAEKIQTDLQLAEYQTRLENLQEQLSSNGFFDQTYLTPSTNNDFDTPFSTLLQQLSDAELERLELLQKRTENHPDVIAIDDRIGEIRKSLTEFNENTITSYQIIINSLRKKQSDLQNLIRSYSNKARNLASSEAELMELVRNRNTYEKMYLLLSDKREEMRIAELSKVQDIVIVEAAVTPMEPILPRKRINIMIGLVVGLMMGLTLALLREFNSKTLSNLREVEDGLMIPILAIMPTYPSEIKDRIRKNYSILNHLDLLTDTRHGFKESYRMLRTKLSFILSTKRSPIKNNILFTSCEEKYRQNDCRDQFFALAGSGWQTHFDHRLRFEEPDSRSFLQHSLQCPWPDRLPEPRLYCHSRHLYAARRPRF